MAGNRTVKWKRLGIFAGVILVIAIDTLFSLRFEHIIFPEDSASSWLPFILVLILGELTCIILYLFVFRDVFNWLFPKNKTEEKPK
jgi:hypothetical protein